MTIKAFMRMLLLNSVLLITCPIALGASSDDHLSDYWDSVWSERKNSEPNPFAYKTLEILSEKGVDLKKVALLDLGSGDGRDSLLFAQMGAQVTAMDIAEQSLSALKKQALPIKIVAQDFNQLTLPHEQYDVIYAHLSLHYFDDATTQAIFKTIHQALKPQGLLFVKCKSVDDPLYGQGKKVGQDMFHYNHTRHFFSKDYMSSQLKDFTKVSLEETGDEYEGFHSSFIEAVAQKA